MAPPAGQARTHLSDTRELWRLWNTKEGFESWWGGEGSRPYQRLTLTPIIDFVPGVIRYESTVAVDSSQLATPCAW